MHTKKKQLKADTGIPLLYINTSIMNFCIVFIEFI